MNTHYTNQRNNTSGFNKQTSDETIRTTLADIHRRLNVIDDCLRNNKSLRNVEKVSTSEIMDILEVTIDSRLREEVCKRQMRILFG